ncbi:MAG TPA: L,D-transpeptidase family protein [Thermoanaerobaculia bacterium]|nr:L,D-transpeptidase family protein [Thermoanaerobaculia bacterium]
MVASTQDRPRRGRFCSTRWSVRLAGGVLLVTFALPAGSAAATPAAATARAEVTATSFTAFLDGHGAPGPAHLRELAQRFYAERRGRPAWLGRDDRPTKAARALVETLSDAARHGLDPATYDTARLADLLAAPPAGEAAYDFEVRLTAAFLLFAAHLAHGRAATGSRWPSPPRRSDLVAALADAARSGRPDRALDRLAPSREASRRLTAALADYREIAADGGWGEVPDGETLKEGEAVAPERYEALIARLALTADLSADTARELGVHPPGVPGRRGIGSWFRRPPPPEAGAGEPRLYDERLAEAVRHFQRRHGLTVDGVVGPATLAALNVPVERRIETLALNLERWRWLADDLGDLHVLVDIGGQELVAYEQGRPALRMNVVVGTATTPTPPIASEIEYLVANPSWYVPTSILRNEIEPRLARDPGYLKRNGYERLPNGGVRQRPGPGNALGQLKFIFPNEHSVYLHDTPSRHLFDHSTRAYSHGCVRIAEPRALAEWLLAGQEELALLDRFLEQGVERRVDLERKVAVHLLYWTASVGTGGEVRFHRDVYGRDAPLRASL